MNILVPDLPEFRDLARWEIDVTPYTAQDVPAVASADGLVFLLDTPADTRRRLMATPGLRWVLTLSAGVNHLLDDLPPGVDLYNASRLHAPAVAAHTLATMLAAARGLHLFRDRQRAGQWQRSGDLRTLRGETVALWGAGHIGRELAAALQPLGAEVRGVRSSTGESERAEIRAEADWLVLLLPSTPQTRGLVDAGFLAEMKPGAWLVNMGRGDLVDTDALLASLQSGHLAGAVLDVTDPEPLPADHPLWSMPNVIITPHVASATADLTVRAARYTRDFIQNQLLGRANEGVVDTQRGY